MVFHTCRVTACCKLTFCRIRNLDVACSSTRETSFPVNTWKANDYVFNKLKDLISFLYLQALGVSPVAPSIRVGSQVSSQPENNQSAITHVWYVESGGGGSVLKCVYCKCAFNNNPVQAGSGNRDEMVEFFVSNDLSSSTWVNGRSTRDLYSVPRQSEKYMSL